MCSLTKTCSGCGTEKLKSEFYTEHRNKDGLMCKCKKCWCEYSSKNRRIHHPPKPRPVYKAKICKFCGRAKALEELVPRKDRHGKVIYISVCKDCDLERRRKRYSDKISDPIIGIKIRSYQSKYNTSDAKLEANRKYRAENPLSESERIAKNHRGQVYQAVRAYIDNKKNYRLDSYVGCNIDFLMSYLEKTAPEGFTWNQYEYQKFHIDHKIATTLFDLTNEDSRKKCFHYTNMQILSRHDNQSKGNREGPLPNLLNTGG
jgi:hypothetical protein